MIAGVILVGGKSTRMGNNKALLDFGSIPLVDHMMKLAKQSGCNEVFLSGKLKGYECLEDIRPHLGPVGGIASTMLQLEPRYKAALFLPVDMPGLSPLLLQHLMDSLLNDGVHFEDHPLPLYLARNDRVLKTMVALQKNNPSVHSLKGYLGLRVLPAPENTANAFNNLNTPEAYAQFALATRAQNHP